jgi:DNA-binding response OmpR family regulator
VTRIAIVADDLIWASRLSAAVERAGAVPVRLSGGGTLPPEPCDGAIVDLARRRGDGIEIIARLREAGLPVIALADHDDAPLRKRALAAGADRVLAYRKMHADGPEVVAAWLAALAAAGNGAGTGPGAR